MDRSLCQELKLELSIRLHFAYIYEPHRLEYAPTSKHK